MLERSNFVIGQTSIIRHVKIGVQSAHESPAVFDSTIPLEDEAWYQSYFRGESNQGEGLFSLRRKMRFRIRDFDFVTNVLGPQFLGRVYIVEYRNRCIVLVAGLIHCILYPFFNPNTEGVVHAVCLDRHRSLFFPSFSNPSLRIPGSLSAHELIERLLIPPWEYEGLRSNASSSQGLPDRVRYINVLDLMILDPESGEEIGAFPTLDPALFGGASSSRRDPPLRAPSLPRGRRGSGRGRDGSRGAGRRGRHPSATRGRQPLSARPLNFVRPSSLVIEEFEPDEEEHLPIVPSVRRNNVEGPDDYLYEGIWNPDFDPTSR